MTSTKYHPPLSKPCLCSSGMNLLQISVYVFNHLFGPERRMLCGRMSLLPNVEMIGIDRAFSGLPPLLKTCTNFSVIHLLVFSTSSAVRGILSSLSCRAESPVQTTKSMLSLMFSSIHLKVAFIRANGVSQSEVSAPYVPARPLPL